MAIRPATFSTVNVPVTTPTGTLVLETDLAFSGMIVATGRATVPSIFWLMCDGSAVSRTTYANLFTAIGTTYGVGDGLTTFNVPDLRGRFPLGKAAAGTGNTLGTNGGALDHTHTGPSHTHTYTDVVNHTHPVNITDPGHDHDGYDTGADTNNRSPTGDWTFADTAVEPNVTRTATTGITATTSNPGGGVATGTTAASGTGATGTANPAYLVVNYMIKT